MRGWLGRERAQGIAHALAVGNTFQCHKTKGRDAQQCAGALVMLKRAQGGFSGALSVACALRLLRYQDLDLDAPVFNSLDAFVERHTRANSSKGALARRANASTCPFLKSKFPS